MLATAVLWMLTHPLGIFLGIALYVAIARITYIAMISKNGETEEDFGNAFIWPIVWILRIGLWIADVIIVPVAKVVWSFVKFLAVKVIARLFTIVVRVLDWTGRKLAFVFDI